MDFLALLIILFFHYVADFVFQTSWMAENKSSSMKALGWHIATYSIPFFIVGIKYAVLNALLHGIVDYFSSRQSKRAYQEKSMKEFWIIIGLDQLVHQICLIGTFFLLK